MRVALWPEGSADEHRAEAAALLGGEVPFALWTTLLAEDESGQLVGFAEVSVRPFAEGCHTSRVAYLEGWFVEATARQQGVGRALLEAAEAWGRAQGCTEFASDTQADNRVSAAAHAALGFEDVGLVRCFRKKL